MAKIDGGTVNVHDLFSGRRYEIDSYQREYRWETSNIEELLGDLQKAFVGSVKPGDTRKNVKDYKPYFLGTVVLSEQDGRESIIDGQQRITTLTLLLIYLNNLQKERSPHERVPQLDKLIFDDHYGEQAFTIASTSGATSSRPSIWTRPT